ncbi:hypothetical protein M758_UG226200 [Ceratodon purpureus]|nr:hypothetical protein M758_UG226200 [Ceratodon purpureus]
MVQRGQPLKCPRPETNCDYPFHRSHEERSFFPQDPDKFQHNRRDSKSNHPRGWSERSAAGGETSGTYNTGARNRGPLSLSEGRSLKTPQHQTQSSGQFTHSSPQILPSCPFLNPEQDGREAPQGAGTTNGRQKTPAGFPVGNSSWYVEAQLIARAKEKYPHAIEDLFCKGLEDIELKRIKEEHTHKKSGAPAPFVHQRSVAEEVGFYLIDILPWTHLPPVMQAIVFMQNVASYYNYMHDEEINNFLRFSSNPLEEECYYEVLRFLQTLQSQSGLQRDTPQCWRDLLQEARNTYQIRLL